MVDHTQALPRTPEGQRNGIVAYLDILGARRIFSSPDSRELADLLQFAANYERSAHEAVGMPSMRIAIPRQFVPFQDSLVRCTEVGWAPEPTEPPTEAHAESLMRWVLSFIDEIASLRDIQLNFVCKQRVLLRGGASFGAYDITDGRVHGPAFLRALTGEEKQAEHPRILVEHSIATFPMPPMQKGWMDQNVKVDADGAYFIDYLNGAAHEGPWSASWFLEVASEHKNLIGELQKSIAEIPADKLAWLRTYHNETIQRLGAFIENRGKMDPEDLMV